jgi:hypothetical protein
MGLNIPAKRPLVLLLMRYHVILGTPCKVGDELRLAPNNDHGNAPQ